jgi:hypothetical protein
VIRDEGMGAGGEKNGGRGRSRGGRGGGRGKGKGKGRKGPNKSAVDPTEEGEDLNEWEGEGDPGVCATVVDSNDQLALLSAEMRDRDAMDAGGSVSRAGDEEAVEGGGVESSGSLVHGAVSGIGGSEVSRECDGGGGGQSMEITYDESNSAPLLTIPLESTDGTHSTHPAPEGSEGDGDSVQEKKRRRVCIEDPKPNSVPMALIPAPPTGPLGTKERGVHGQGEDWHTLAVRAPSKDSEDRGEVTAQEGGDEEGDEDRMVQCNECFRWVHALCEGIDQSQYEAMTRGTHPVWVRSLAALCHALLLFIV